MGRGDSAPERAQIRPVVPTSSGGEPLTLQEEFSLAGVPGACSPGGPATFDGQVEGLPFLECGGSTPLWVLGSLARGPETSKALSSHRTPNKSNNQSGVEPPHSKLVTRISPVHRKIDDLLDSAPMPGRTCRCDD